MFAKLTEIVGQNNGLWCLEAEQYLLATKIYLDSEGGKMEIQCNLGKISYSNALELQQKLLALRQQQKSRIFCC